MILLIAGASHTGKTALAQRLLEKYHYPYLSVDHLKMGLIRSGYTSLTPVSDDQALTAYLWPVVREMIKTAIENRQNLIVEGCYIPFDWSKDFEAEYLEEIAYCCLVMSKEYIHTHFQDIKAHAGIVENRGKDEDCTPESVLRENALVLSMCKQHRAHYLLIDGEYRVDADLRIFDKNCGTAEADGR
ncbi:MAG: ATP-binding protein [bacterium]|nr:ATP-binding protein [bacterium]